MPTPNPTSRSKPPVAARKEHITDIHGVELKDDYFWLRERENPDVIAYLEAENTYTDSVNGEHRSATENPLR